MLSISRNNESYKWTGYKIENKIGLADSSCEHLNNITLDHFHEGRWGYVYYFVKIPDNIQDGDRISLHLSNIGKREIFIDDLCLE